MLSERNEGIKAAYNELTAIKNDDVKRQIYNSRKKAIMDYNVQNRAAREEGIEEGIKKGIEKGIEKGILQMAKNMLKNGLDIELISNITGLSKEAIENIKSEGEDKIN